MVVTSCSSPAVVSKAAAVRTGFKEGLEDYERRDYTAALKTFRPLAEEGNADAQFYVAVMYYNGQGVPQNDEEAVQWFRKAAVKGHARAENNLGGLYMEGRGVPRDNKEAAKWYRRAAEQGLAQAQYNLGFMYGKGAGVPRDFVLAYMWFSLALENGIQSADELRNAAGAFLTPAQMEKAQRLVREWKPKKS